MKKYSFFRLLPISFLIILFLATSCRETWDNYYAGNELASDSLEVFQGTISDYVKTKADLSVISGYFDKNGVFDKTSSVKDYTFIVCSNTFLSASQVSGTDAFAKYSVSDVSLSPTKLTDGLGIVTRAGKNIWVSKKNGATYLNNLKVEKMVKTSNGYIYYIGGVLKILPSVYEYFESLGSNYSYFTSLVKRYQETFFDKDKSTPISVDPMGNTVYDSVMTKRNTMIDRYTIAGLKSWDMFSEDFQSTMFIPSNDLINNAINTALANIPVWLNRPATAADRLKFEDWIVRACFVNRRMKAADVTASATNDFYCVDGYKQVINLAQDAKTYEPVNPAAWRPSVQTVNASSPVELSNGVAYYMTNLKIPNHIVIYRVKSKFYELWAAMTDTQKKKYFQWTNFIDPLIVNDAQGSFTLTESLPTMYYHVLTARPTDQAVKDSLQCSVTYDGVLYNSTTKKLIEAHLPAGEYNLRMGFKHSLRYSIDIYFNDDLLVEDMMLYAQGSNYHFDRGSVSDMDYYGNSAIGYPEGFNWKEWIEKDVKAVAYDTDGYQVAVVNIPKDGNFTITIKSKDMGKNYDLKALRDKSNVKQLMMYHWCLRPTVRNY